MSKLVLFLIVVFVTSLVSTLVGHFLGLNVLMKQGPLGMFGVVLYDVTMMVIGCVISATISYKEPLEPIKEVDVK